jgi:hypothetical protein
MWFVEAFKLEMNAKAVEWIENVARSHLMIRSVVLTFLRLHNFNLLFLNVKNCESLNICDFNVFCSVFCPGAVSQNV